MKVEDLAEADVPEMLALTALTEPGPFRDRICLGGYCGIRDQRPLVAMAGRRTAVPGYREVSAVCTQPSYRGRGYGAALVCAVSDGIMRLGSFLIFTSGRATPARLASIADSDTRSHVLWRGRSDGCHILEHGHAATLNSSGFQIYLVPKSQASS